METDRLFNDDCFNVLKDIPSNSLDFPLGLWWY